MRRVKVAYPVKIDKLIGGGMTPTLRLQRALGTPGRFRAWEKLLVWSHWVWFAFPHGTVAVPDPAPSRADEPRRRADLRDVRHRADRLLGDPDRSALVRRRRGPHGGRPHPRAATHDGRVRRAVLAVRLGPSVRCPGRKSACCHAVAALRHVRNGRACAGRDGRASRARLGWTYTALLGIALVYLGEHYVVDLIAGLALAEGVRRGCAGGGRRSHGGCRTWCRRSRLEARA